MSNNQRAEQLSSPSISRRREDRLRNAGFSVSVVTRPAGDGETPGYVVDQTPKGGSDAIKGSKVEIIVAEESDEEPPSPSPSPSPSDDGGGIGWPPGNVDPARPVDPDEGR